MYSNYDGEPRINRQAAGIGLLFIGVIAMVLEGAILLAMLLSPTALQDDSSIGPYFLALFSVPISSLLVLISLLLLKVHWLLVIGAFLLSLLAAYTYVQGWFLPHPPSVGAYGVLIYGGGVILLSLVLVVVAAMRKRTSSTMRK